MKKTSSGSGKKAKLGNVFEVEVAVELGYRPEFIERATKEIITRLAVR